MAGKRESAGRASIQPTINQTSQGDAQTTDDSSSRRARAATGSQADKPRWEVIGFWDYDAVDAQQMQHGLHLQQQAGSRGPYSWQWQLQLVKHDQLPARTRQLWPVQINRVKKEVCVNAPYPSFPAYIDLPDHKYDGIYAFAPCAGGIH